ncbi:hypothetical protein SFRURICE_019429 [Spodoptera frugiperda]|nr:hypothetical protein SFRURICE_019429 [Spodoptera frugiperda]
MNKKDIEVSCHNGDQRSKRETIPGGLTEKNPNDPKYRALAEESLRKFIVESGTTEPLQMVRVEKVTTQVVSGLMTRIDFVISGGQDINKCHSKIWEQPWMNKKDIEVSCHNGDQRSKRETIPGGLTEKNPNDPKYRALAEESLRKFITESGTTEPLQMRGGIKRFDPGQGKDKRETIPGGLTEKNPNDPKYRALAEESLRKFITESGTTEPLQMVRVEKVTTQVVSGLMTRIDCDIGWARYQ